MEWFNPTDVGNSSKESWGYTKTRFNSSTCPEVARPRKSIPILYPRKRGNNLGSVNSDVCIRAPAYTLLIQEAWPNVLRLASLPLKSCSYCSPDRRCFKTLFWRQTNYFYQPPSEITLKWERPFMDVWSKNPQMSSSSGLTIFPCKVLNPAALLPTPKGSLPFHSCLETLGHWTKPWEGLSEEPVTNPEEIWYTHGSSFVLGGKKKSRICSGLQFWDHRG